MSHTCSILFTQVYAVFQCFRTVTAALVYYSEQDKNLQFQSVHCKERHRLIQCEDVSYTGPCSQVPVLELSCTWSLLVPCHCVLFSVFPLNGELFCLSARAHILLKMKCQFLGRSICIVAFVFNSVESLSGNLRIRKLSIHKNTVLF